VCNLLEVEVEREIEQIVEIEREVRIFTDGSYTKGIIHMHV